ncbi:hypothetical protein D9M68_853740 [compost metagenome]
MAIGREWGALDGFCLLNGKVASPAKGSQAGEKEIGLACRLTNPRGADGALKLKITCHANEQATRCTDWVVHRKIT